MLKVLESKSTEACIRTCRCDHKHFVNSLFTCISESRTTPVVYVGINLCLLPKAATNRFCLQMIVSFHLKLLHVFLWFHYKRNDTLRVVIVLAILIIQFNVINMNGFFRAALVIIKSCCCQDVLKVFFVAAKMHRGFLLQL